MIRKAVYAGSFYPAEKTLLNKMLDTLFNNCIKKKINGKIRAVIVPHAGYIYSGIVAAAGYKCLGSDFKKVIILGPSHQFPIDEPVADESDEWITPLSNMSVDVDIIKKIGIKMSSAAHKDEHSLEVQIPFLQKVLKSFSIAPVAVNYYDADFAEKLKKIVSEEVLVVVSSDLSHYLPYDKAVEVDRKTIKSILNLDFNEFREYGEACGNAGVLTLIKIAKDLKWKPVLVDYRNSGDTAGDKKGVVGYASIVFTE